MKKLLFTTGIILLFCSCSDTKDENELSSNDEIKADCPCSEIEKNNDGKFVRNVFKKDGDVVKVGEIFTGLCDERDENNVVLKRQEFTNGYMKNSKSWDYLGDSLILLEDMNFTRGTNLVPQYGSWDNAEMKETSVFSNGFYKTLHYDGSVDISLIREYVEYKDGEIYNRWQVDVNPACIVFVHKWVENGKKNRYPLFSSMQAAEEDNITCALQLESCLGAFPTGDQLKQFVSCLKDQNLKEFLYQGDLGKIENNYTTPHLVDDEDEQFQNLESEINYFTISDPDGYSNLRKVPSGEIIKKIFEGELFEVIGEKNNHKKVKLKDGTIGFVHESRVVQISN